MEEKGHRESVATSRKRLHPSKNGPPPESAEEEPKSKRGHHEGSGSEASSGEEGRLEIATTPPKEAEEQSPSEDMLSDLPEEALHATTRAQFVHHMRPYVWVKFPSAMASEINAFINLKWNLLKASRKMESGKGERRRRSEVDTLGAQLNEEEEFEGGTSRSSRQRAAKKVAKNAYTMDFEEFEYVDSPASSANSKDTGSTGGGRTKKEKQRPGRKKKRRGRPPAVPKEEVKAEPRVPPMKIKMIGRSGESDSPIFFAESMESWDEGSGSERGMAMQKKSRKDQLKERGLDSENSSVVLGDREEEEEELQLLEGSSRPPSDGELEEGGEVHADSEGEHADYCYTCKDGGELLCCDFCPLAYHLKCLVPPMSSIPTDDWRCPRCEAEPLGCKVEHIHTWRWTDIPIEKSGGDGGVATSDLEDDVMAEDRAENEAAPKTYRIREFFVKWQGKSYWKNSWVSEIRIDVYQPITLRAYMRKHNMDMPPKLELPPHVQRRHKRRSTASHCDEKMEDQEIMLIKAGVRPQWLQIHRVINKRNTRKGPQYLVKWRDLSYYMSTWEYLGEDCGLKSAPQAIKDYEDLRRLMDPKKKEKKRGRKPKVVLEPISKYEEQPACIAQTGGTLHPYQLEGLNWLRFSWSQHTNTILADEMGLGKTIQTIAFLYSLYKEGRSNGPFLISAPLSTIVNWSREFEFWAPDLYVVTYTGDKDNRAAIREHEFSFVDGAVRKSNTRLFKMKDDVPLKFHVLLTSYEFITVDCTVLQSINWEVLVVDEAHRLKNNQSKFFRFLNGYDIKYKLLLTGTPLQNNLEELFHLLNFLNPIGFDSLEQFQEEFEDISKEDQVSKLHDLLAPHLLRRLKADVLKNIPPKRELIVRVDLAPMQKKYYRWILTRNFEKLNMRGSQPVSLLNIMMDLKKCCNHPYLFPTASQEAPLTASGYYQGKELIQASGKFLVLEQMMKRLKEQGHRVLIFSQMTRMLDILEDFLEYLGYKFERIDGNVTGPERQQSIDRFNNPNSEQFVFLLSTRAGGLGINLATADTVIIYDSDWNPHNDIQAFSRAHRIGQSNKVMIYRFVTRSSVEERITEVAKKKMMLTHLVVRPGMGSGGAAPSLSKRELDDILRFGTEDLFKDETSDTTIHYDAKTIEALLDREQEGQDSAEVPGSENLLANEYLSSFKVASYVTKEVDDEEEPETEILKEETDAAAQPDPDFWEKLLRHHYEQQRELEEAKLGKGKRIRKQVNYLDVSEDKGRDSDQSSYQQSDERESESDSDAGQDFVAPGSKRRRGVAQLAAPSSDGLPPLLAKVRDNIYVLGFNPRQRKAFLNSVMRYGMPPPNAFHTHWKMRDLKTIPEKTFNAYVNLFMRHLCEPETPNSTTYSDGVPCEPVSRQNILTRIGIMRLVRNKVEQYSTINGEYSIPEEATPPEEEGSEKREGLGATPSQATPPGDPGDQPTVVQIPPVETDAATVGGEGATAMETAQSGPPSELEKQVSKTSSSTGSPASSVVSGTSASSNTSKETTPTEEEAPLPRKATPPTAEVMEVNSTSDSKADQKPDNAESAPKESSVIVYSSGKGEGSKVKTTPTTSGSGKTGQLKFMFNIADGGFTELHNLWADEKTKGFSPKTWGRHHDYWLLKGLVTHGYCRWSEICGDNKFSLLNKPFSDEVFMTDSKSRFLLKRFKLLEQALAVEEQLHRASNARLYQDPNHSVMQLHSRYTDLDCLADGHAALVSDCLSGDRNSILLMKKAVSKMEELLIEMKSDIGRLPAELAKMPSVSVQLKMDEISTISKLAKTPVSHSVITQAPPSSAAAIKIAARSKSPRPKKDASSQAASTKYKMAYTQQSSTTTQLKPAGPQVQLPTARSLTAVQTADGLVVYSVASSTAPTQPVSVVQAIGGGAASGTITTTSAGQQAIAIGVPASYIEGSNVYQTVQLVPAGAASAQQVVYWPQGTPTVVGSQTMTPAQVTTVPAMAAGGVAGAGVSQLAVVQNPAPQTVLQPVQFSTVDASGNPTGQASVITID